MRHSPHPDSQSPPRAARRRHAESPVRQITSGSNRKNGEKAVRSQRWAEQSTNNAEIATP
eukprot:3988147-Pleurochrysis_carterae.AAC.2